MNIRPSLQCAAIVSLSAHIFNSDLVYRHSSDIHKICPSRDISDSLTPNYEKTTTIKIDDKYTSGVMETWADISDKFNMPYRFRHKTVFSVPSNIIDSLIDYGE